MSAFGGLILTNKGRNLQAKAQAGVTLNFTRIAVGDGDLAGSSILDLSALKNQVKSLTITKFKSLGSGKAVVGGVLSNQDLVSGFYWRELGVFAQDPDLGEILYCYGNSGANAEYIPAGGGPDIVEKSIDVITLVGNAADISATIETSLIFVTVQDFNDLAGAGRTVETVKGVADAQAAHLVAADPHAQYALDTDLSNLAGAGRTTQTVKQNADNLTAHLADYVRQPAWGPTTGSANTYLFASTPALPALVDGVSAYLDVNVANTGASTLNWDGKGAKAIVDGKGNALIAGKMPLNGIVGVRYNASTTNFQLLGEGGDYGTAGAPQTLTGYTLGTANGVIPGTMPEIGSPTFTPSGSAQNLSAGHYSGGTINKISLSVGDGVANSNNSSAHSNLQLAYTKIKETQINGYGGSLRIKFTMTLSYASGNTAYSKIYVNGVAKGIEHTVTTTTPLAISEDITGINPGDLIQIYGYATNVGGQQNSTITNFTININPFATFVNNL